jgi:hypothetical protein
LKGASRDAPFAFGVVVTSWTVLLLAATFAWKAAK